MKRRWAPSLRWRLILVAIGVLAVVLTVFSAVLYTNQRSSLVDATANGLRLSAQPIIADWENRPRPPGGDSPDPRPPGPSGGAAPSDDPERQSLVDLAGRLTTLDTTALTIDPEGNLLGDGAESSDEPAVVPPRLDPAIYADVAETGEERVLRQDTDAGPVLVSLIPLRPQGDADSEVVAVLQLSTSLDTVDLVLGRLRLMLIGGTLIAVVAVVLLLLPLVRGVLGPLRQMASTSRAIAAGDLDRRVPVPAANDELTDLAQAFNHMVGRLDAMLATQRRFLADASHELRSPLTALGGGVEILLLGADRDDPVARSRMLRLMNGEIARMGRLVDELLQLTRFDTNPGTVLQVGRIDLQPLVSQLVDETRLLAPDHRVTLDMAPSAAVLVVSGDADRLWQAVLNLCTNARAYTAPGGSITIGLRREASDAVISVADTGVGISQEDVPRVWDRFYRVEASRARAEGQGGLGLGLAIVRAIVDAHGWTVSIESHPGVGTTVTVTMPAATSIADVSRDVAAHRRSPLIPAPARPSPR